MRPAEHLADVLAQRQKTSLLEGSDSLCTFSSTYGRLASIQHWQLRDLLHCPSAAGQVFSVYRNRVRHHDLYMDVTISSVHLPFEPTSMTVGHNFCAAGGQCSQLEAWRLGGDGPPPMPPAAIISGHCGGSVNNALRVARDAGRRMRLFVCNNDDTVKIFSLRSGAMVGHIRTACAINYCALSPDGAHLVAVGDSRHVFLYQATPTGYRQLRVLTEAADAGMGCDWSPSGGCFAAAAQDGTLAVWDHRGPTVLALYRTPLACRSVKFSPAPLDMLAFAEHRGRLHVVDQRMWGREQHAQVLHVGPSPEAELDIAGVAFSPCGTRLYCGTEDSILEYSVDTGARRAFACAELC